MPINHFDGPIPGSNYTSDRRNYPWHRPPEHTDIDKAIEYISKKLTKNESLVGLLTLMQAGQPITNITQLFLMSGVMSGKWTLDFALMLAGPTAHMLVIMAKSYGIKYNLGLKTKMSDSPTMAFFDAIKKINSGKAAAAGRKVIDSVDDIEQNTSMLLDKGGVKLPETPKFTGFMSKPNPNEQQQMMGQQPTQPSEEIPSTGDA